MDDNNKMNTYTCCPLAWEKTFLCPAPQVGDTKHQQQWCIQMKTAVFCIHVWKEMTILMDVME